MALSLTDTIIESARLRLVPISEKYAEDVFREFTEEITLYMFPRSPKQIGETLAYIREARREIEAGTDFTVVVLHKESGDFLGGGGLHKIDTDTPEFGIWIKKSAHGNGYGKEAVCALKDWADKNLSYKYLVYPVDKKNTASRKIAEALGGVIERERQITNQAGNVLDEVEYRIYPNAPMKWVAISGSWHKTNQEVENDVRSFVRDVIARGDGIITGGAFNVDYFATDEVLRLNPEATQIKVCLPVTLEKYAAHYHKRADEGVITHAQAEELVAQLTKLKESNPNALIENSENAVVDKDTYYERNLKVMKLADDLAAFQVNDSAGTQDTIDKARAQGKPVYLKQYYIE